jgi:diacylglycerol kinase
MKNQSLVKRVGFAINGIGEAFTHESSFRTQILLSFIAIGYFAWIDVTVVWWMMLAIIIALILAGELINSAIELLIDHLHPELHPEIKRVKDMAAGAVLILSVMALIFAILATIEFW